MITKHHEMVRGLVKPGSVILSQLTAEDCHLLHMVIGLMGEAVELEEACVENDLDNLIEEGGDSIFYQTAMFDIFNMEFFNETFKVTHIPSRTDDYTSVCGKILDLVKKKTIYRKDAYDEQIRELLFIARDSLQYMLSMWNISIRTCQDHNYKKLGKRYENHKYSDEQAQLRKDKDGQD